MEKRYSTFTSLILNINRSIQKIKSMEMEEFGLKGNQVECVYNLYNLGGCSLIQLCKLCFEDKAAVSRAIHDLEAKGYVEKLNIDKKYKSLIKLTDEGMELGSIISSKILEMVEKGSDGIDLNKRDEFYANLKKVDNNLKTICKAYGDKNGKDSDR